MILWDSDIVIDHLRGASQATWAFEEARASRNYLSVITIAEIEAGIRDHEHSFVQTFFQAFIILPVTQAIALKAGKYKRTFGKSHHLLLPDALIAATAFCENISLHTLNLKHYPMQDIIIKAPYQRS